MKRITVIPNKDCILRDTDGTLIAPKGKSVNLNTYWSRRIKAGDCTVKEDKKNTAEPIGSSKSSSSTNK